MCENAKSIHQIVRSREYVVFGGRMFIIILWRKTSEYAVHQHCAKGTIRLPRGVVERLYDISVGIEVSWIANHRFALTADKTDQVHFDDRLELVFLRNGDDVESPFLGVEQRALYLCKALSLQSAVSRNRHFGYSSNSLQHSGENWQATHVNLSEMKPAIDCSDSPMSRNCENCYEHRQCASYLCDLHRVLAPGQFDWEAVLLEQLLKKQCMQKVVLQQ